MLGTLALVGWFLTRHRALPPSCLLLAWGNLRTYRLANASRPSSRRWSGAPPTSSSFPRCLRRLESHPFNAPLLNGLVKSLETDGHPSSHQIRRLAKLLHLLDYRKNQLFMPVAVLWLWTTQIAVRIDACAAGRGRESSIGSRPSASSRPSARWRRTPPKTRSTRSRKSPRARPGGGRGDRPPFDRTARLRRQRRCARRLDPRLDGQRIEHVRQKHAAANGRGQRRAGACRAPVRAARLRLTPLAIGATLRIQDSLQAGRSRFYAEITRVRQLVDLSRGPLPLLFLFDELFNGTNSHDRCVGAESVVQGLIGRRCNRNGHDPRPRPHAFRGRD